MGGLVLALLLAAPAAPGAEAPLRVASEYRRLTLAWIERRGLDAQFVRSYGATEVFPPDDADCIVDNSATGSTLRANKLAVVGELMQSSTRLFAHPGALARRWRALAPRSRSHSIVVCSN